MKARTRDPDGAEQAGARPVVFLDTSALVRRYVHGAGRDLVLATMSDRSPWCASALARTEVLLALRQVAAHPHQEADLWRTARDDWDAFWVVPVDGRCLAGAVEIGARFGLRTVDAIHLAAADRLPRPLRYVTFDRRQIPAAAGLDFEVVSPLAS
jgi:predicted nucleic acid-binding protein